MTYKSSEELLRMASLTLHDSDKISTTTGETENNRTREQFLNSMINTLSQLGLEDEAVKKIYKDKGLL